MLAALPTTGSILGTVKDLTGVPLAGWTVYADLNNNGKFDTGDVGAGTASNGTYKLTVTGSANTIAIREIVRTGWQQASPADSYSLVVLAGDNIIGKDFSNKLISGAVAGTVKDAAGNPLSGWGVYADLNSNGKYDTGDVAVGTATNGTYKLTILNPTNSDTPFVIGVVPRTGWQTPAPVSQVVHIGDNIVGIDFTNTLISGAVAGTVKDVNGNPLGGWGVYADLNNNGKYDTGDVAVGTATNGAYKLTILNPTNSDTPFVIGVMPRYGWQTPAPVSRVVHIGDNIVGVDFTNRYVLGTVAGTVKDVGGAGLASWMVYADLNLNGKYDSGETYAYTSTTGAYKLTLTNTTGSDTPFVIRETLKTGWQAVTPAGGSLSLVVRGGDNLTGQDFTNRYVLGTVAGTVKDTAGVGLASWMVYADLNLNGKYDSGEAYAYTSTTGDYKLTLTNATGSDTPFVIRETLKTGWQAVTPAGGSLSLVVHGGDNLTGQNFTVKLISGTVSGTVKDTAGNPLSGWGVYADLNSNGKYDTGDVAVGTATNGAYKLTVLNPTNSDTPFVIGVVPRTGWQTPAPVSQVVHIGDNIAGVDFTNTLISGAVAGTVKDATGAGLASWLVFADLNTNGKYDSGEAYAYSASNGAYKLTVPNPTNTDTPFVIAVAPRTGWQIAAPVSQVVHIGDNIAGVDFTNTLVSGAVAGTIKDANGVALAGWMVYADLNGNGKYDSGETYACTSSTGAYKLTILNPTNSDTPFVIAVMPRTGWQIAAPVSTMVHIGDNITVDFTNKLISGAVAGTLKDANGNPLASWMVYADLNANGKYDSGETYAYSSSTGAYKLTIFNATNSDTPFVIRQMPRAGWTMAAPVSTVVHIGDNVTVDFTNTLISGAVAGTIKDAAGNPLAGWTVYADLNNNGRYDTGDVGTASGNTGAYKLLLLNPTNSDTPFVIRQVPRAGWITAGPLSQVVHIGDNITGLDFANTLISGTVAGTLKDASGVGLSGWTVYADLNNNGTFDEGDVGAITAADGTYKLLLLNPTNSDTPFAIRQILMAGWEQVTAPAPTVVHIGDSLFGLDFNNKLIDAAMAQFV